MDMRWWLEHRQLESATMDKAHLLIDANSSGVGLNEVRNGTSFLEKMLHATAETRA